jgi:hypothetical protein
MTDYPRQGDTWLQVPTFYSFRTRLCACCEVRAETYTRRSIKDVFSRVGLCTVCEDLRRDADRRQTSQWRRKNECQMITQIDHELSTRNASRL